uniref:Uncharacterized protein n=1 Tax=Arundo donax TaxID=35708 RepID=A0A0A9BJ25_ARUDO
MGAGFLALAEPTFLLETFDPLFFFRNCRFETDFRFTGFLTVTFLARTAPSSSSSSSWNSSSSSSSNSGSKSMSSSTSSSSSSNSGSKSISSSLRLC